MQYTEIKTVADAFKAAGIDMAAFESPFANLPEKYGKPLLDHAKLVVVAEALNDGWKPNWNDEDERKWVPWFEVIASDEQPSGSALSFDDYVDWYTTANVGSRLCFKSSQIAKYAAEQFKELYEGYFLIK